MEQFNELFEHMPEYRIIVCRQCRFAVVPKQVARHVHDQHPTMSGQQRRAIVQASQNIPDLAREKDDVRYPRPDEPPIPGLPVYGNGFRCRYDGDCKYVCRSLWGIKKHSRDEHGWTGTQKRGGNVREKDPRVPDRIWIANQPCQRYFEYGPWQKYFPIRIEEEEVPVHDPRIREQQAEEQFARMEAKLEEAAKERQINGESHRFEANPWLDFTGWHKHLEGFERARLYGLLQPAEGEGSGGNDQNGKRPDENNDGDDGAEIDPYRQIDHGLAQACRATKRVIRAAYKQSDKNNVSRAALESVSRRESGADTNEKPFFAEQQVKTIRKYTIVWLKVLRYIWRTFEHEQRPKYRTTKQQLATITALRTASRAQRGMGSAPWCHRIEQATMAFWLSMFNHELKDDEYESPMLSGLAMMGLDERTNGWVTALSYTPMLSAVVTTMRAMVVHQARQEREQEIRRFVADGMDEDDAKDQAIPVVTAVDRLVERFMVLREFNGIVSPMDRILRQRAYGRKIRNTTKAEGRVGWQGDTILIDRISFSMDDIRCVVHGLNETVRRRLIEDVMIMPVRRDGVDWKPEGLPRFELAQLFDNAADMSEGWSFLADVRTQWPVDGRKWMWRRLFQEPALEKRFIVGSLDDVNERADMQWSERGVEEYFRRVRRFKEEMMALVHLSGGAPARATELTSVQHKNGQEARAQRGVFIQDGMVVFVTSYHKGYGANKIVKIVHRYVPHEVGELVVYYLWLVQPFVEHVQSMAREQYEHGSFWWEPTPKEEWQAGEDEEERVEGAESEVEVDEGEMEEPIPFHGQTPVRTPFQVQGSLPTPSTMATSTPCPHRRGGEPARESPTSYQPQSSPIEAAIRARPVRSRQPTQVNSIVEPGGPTPLNVDGFWDTDRVRHVLQRETERRIGVKIGVAVWRQVYPAIQREYCKNPAIRSALDQIYGSRSNGPVPTGLTIDDIIAKQSGHSRQMEEMIYGLLLTESPTSTREEREMFRQVSIDWHRFLRFPSAWQEAQVDPNIQRRIHDEQEDQRFRRWQQIRAVDPTRELQRMYGPEAQFRSVQQAGMDAIMKGTPHVLIVMRTGGGKSLFFMLPAAGSKDGVTIVIVPMVSLREDLHDRCRKANIPCAEWDGQRPPYHARIILVTPESAVSLAFGRFIDEQRLAHRLERIVVDECHTVLESHDEWRPDVLRLSEMASKGIQTVYLTATLPPKEEDVFYQTVGVRREDMAVFRDRTTRPNVAYSVVQYNKEDEDEAVRALVEAKKEEYPVGQIVVFCSTIKQAKQLSEVLKCSVYYAGMGTAADKKQVLQSLTRQTGRVFTATNALGLGVDAASIRVVIHVGIRKKMKQYAQESGRAGRDGQRSEAIILQSTWTGRDGKVKVDQGWQVDGAMTAFISGERCRRVALDEEMDGERERRACRTGEEQCDRCRGQPRGEKRRRIRVVVAEDEDVAKRRRVDDGEKENKENEENEDVREQREIERRMDQQRRERQQSEARRLKEASQQRHNMQQQQTQFTASQQQARDTASHRAGAIEQLSSQFDRWSTGCAICRMRGRERQSHRHGWRHCPYGEADRTTVEKAWEAVRVPWHGVGVCCMACWAPQAICHAWENVSHGGPSRYRKQHGRACQFQGTLREAAAAMIGLGGDEVVDYMEGEGQYQAVREQAEYPRGWEGIKRWLGGRVEIHGIDMSGLCCTFWRFCTTVWPEEGADNPGTQGGEEEWAF